ncbi:MAG TPA: diguanylate cyclase, partial [Vicinamibacterales bacterium]|nr:diguanylate cyclase [Vicinamibacterales bacterium]
YDICVRYAGDEFIVVLSGCGADEAERKRLELQKAVQDMEFEVRPGRRLPLGMSIGTAVFPHDGEVYEMLLATADGRMYRDKARRKRTADARAPQSAGAAPDSPAPEIGEPAGEGAGTKLERAASGRP